MRNATSTAAVIVALSLLGPGAHARTKLRSTQRVTGNSVTTDWGNGKKSVTTFSPAAGGHFGLRVKVVRFSRKNQRAPRVSEYRISRFCEVEKVNGGDSSALTGRFQRNTDQVYPGRRTNPVRARPSRELTEPDLLKLDRALNAAIGTGRPWDYKDLGQGHLGRWTKERRAMLGPKGRKNTTFGKALRHAIRQFREGEELAGDSHIGFFGGQITGAMDSAAPKEKARLLKILKEATVTRRPANILGYRATDSIVVHSPGDSVTIQNGKIQRFDGDQGLTMAQVRKWIGPRRQLPRP